MVAAIVSDLGLLFAGATFLEPGFWNQVGAESRWVIRSFDESIQAFDESIQGESTWKVAGLMSSMATSFGIRWLLLDRLVGMLGPFIRPGPNGENARFLIAALKFTYN
ncbi:MAG: hypothetical protein CMJ81_23565 [Planctomycetaceae bacterium]|nr:hypothetical protein [Planctomycetaceae bacterium]